MTLTTALIIRRHINGIQPKQVFSIRDLLPYGSRQAVDQTMYRMVKNGSVFRVARGLYVRYFDVTKTPPKDLVAKIKAEGFAKETAQHGKKCASDQSLALENTIETIYATTGSTSNFDYRGKTIKFHKLAPRKLVLKDSKIGQFIRAYWALGPKYCYDRRTGSTIDFAQLIKQKFNPYEQEELRMARKWMPAWLSDRIFAHDQVYLPKFQQRRSEHPAYEDRMTNYYALENWGWTFSN